MSDAKHTPGPWQCCIAVENEYADFRVREHVETGISVDGRRWRNWLEASTDQYGYFQPNDKCDISAERIANARLIAAAPQLLAALEDMLGGWRYIRQAHGDLYGVGWDRAQELAEKAIAKAKGES